MDDPFDDSAVTWTEIVSSTSEDWGGFFFNIQTTTTILAGSAGNIIIHFAIGGSGSEARFATLTFSTFYNTSGMAHYVPIPISSGSRISAAICTSNNLTVFLGVSKVPASSFTSTPSFTTMDAGPYDLDSWNAAVVPSSLFFTIDPGGSANTKGSYTELSFTGGTYRGNNILNGDSLGQAYDYLGFHLHLCGNSTKNTYNWLVDIAYGAASSETVFVSDVYVSTTNRESFSHNNILWVPWGRASGDRISVRAQCSGTDSTDRLIQVTMYGLR